MYHFGIFSLKNCKRLHIQWIPSHCGIKGNDIADLAAKHGLCQPQIENIPTPESQIKKFIRKETHNRWSRTALTAIRTSHLGQIRDDPGPQPWTRSRSRRLDTAITRLRIGHTALNAHLHRIGVVEDPACEYCGQDETIHHLFFVCPRYHSERTILQGHLREMNVPYTTKNLLGGGPYERETQSKILRFLKIFLKKTNRLATL